MDVLEELQHRDASIDDAFAGEIRKAVGMLKSLAWDDIRTERFPLTPLGIYFELVRNAEAMVNKHVEESLRREALLGRDDGIYSSAYCKSWCMMILHSGSSLTCCSRWYLRAWA